jgi:hypothetical protein
MERTGKESVEPCLNIACYLLTKRDVVVIVSASLSDVLGLEYLPGNLGKFLIVFLVFPRELRLLYNRTQTTKLFLINVLLYDVQSVHVIRQDYKSLRTKDTSRYLPIDKDSAVLLRNLTE